MQKLYPSKIQTAVFDTSFHQTLPEKGKIYLETTIYLAYLNLLFRGHLNPQTSSLAFYIYKCVLNLKLTDMQYLKNTTRITVLEGMGSMEPVINM